MNFKMLRRICESSPAPLALLRPPLACPSASDAIGTRAPRPVAPLCWPDSERREAGRGRGGLAAVYGIKFRHTDKRLNMQGNTKTRAHQ